VTRYELIREQLIDLRTKQLIPVMVPAGIVAALFIAFVSSGAFLIALVAFFISVIGLHWAWQRLFAPYRDWAQRYSQIATEIQSLERCIAHIFDSYPQRRSGEQFKKAYGLNGRSVKDLEEALAVGMLRERREVFLTAFMRQGRAVRVTASIGSPFRCRASDDPMRWSVGTELVNGRSLSTMRRGAAGSIQNLIQAQY
jgi:hypothetical protein